MYKTLDCKFVGERRYIQGSQMICGSAQHICEKHQNRVVMLNSVKFTQITDCGVVLTDRKQQDMTQIGLIDCSIETKTNLYYLYSNNVKVTNREIEGIGFTPEFKFTDIDGLNGRIEFHNCDSSLSSILQTVVEASKQLHLKLSDNIRDVWFTGFNKANLICSESIFPKSGEMSFNHRLTMGKGRYQTLSEVSIRDGENKNTLNQFALMFAYKT